jgi:putative membrane protein insertion efficiency factor
MKTISLKIIKFYQRIISPDHGFLKKVYPFGFCRFNPTCSEYAYESIERFGFIKGISLGFWRIVRCNPFSRGGSDPVPQKIKKNYLFYGLISMIIYFTIIVSLVAFIIERINT